MTRSKSTFLALVAVLLSPMAANADFIPVGVQTNVDINTVTSGWGWTMCYQSLYADNFGTSAATALSGCTGDYLMLAGRETGSDNIIALAAALMTDVLMDVGNGANAHHLANGAEWYNSDNYSIGFARGGDSTNRRICDTGAANGAERLCWHTVDFTGGWRVGTNTSLNNSRAYERLAFQLTRVPEPGTLALLGIGLFGMGMAKRKKA